MEVAEFIRSLPPGYEVQQIAVTEVIATKEIIGIAVVGKPVDISTGVMTLYDGKVVHWQNLNGHVGWSACGPQHTDAPNRSYFLDELPLLKWQPTSSSSYTAILGVPGDFVEFTISHHPTCYRRGPYRLLIEVCGGPNHHKWGCFDEQDQPLRNFHGEKNAYDEAERIAKVLQKDRQRIS